MRQTIKQLALTVLVALASLSASAYDFAVDGIRYSVVSTYNLTCKVDTSWCVGNITIPSTVTYRGRTLTVIAIGEGAFYWCDNLQSVTIPNSVTYLGKSTFLKCSLDSITISTKQIGYESFSNSSCSKIVITNSVESIDEYAFYRNTSEEAYVEEMIIEDGSIPLKCDHDMFRLMSPEKLYLGRNMEVVTQYITDELPFESSLVLTEVVIGDSVTSIEKDMFSYCQNLKSVTIGNSVTSIGNYAFDRCYSLKSVTFGNSATSIGNYAFHDCSNLTSVSIPSVTSIGEGAFMCCDSLKTVIIGDSDITSLDSWIFKNCTSLTSITFGGSMLGCNMFTGCGSLKTVTLGKNLNWIDGQSFSDCTSLEIINSLNPVPPTGVGDFTESQYLNVTVNVPVGSLAAYQTANVWKNFWGLQEDPTGINVVKNETGKTDRIFDISGRRLKTPQRGLNIINGKKVVVK